MAETLYLKVVGEHTMHCASCENSITFSLSQLTIVKELKADWKTQSIEINFSDDEVDLEKIISELDWIGYEVEIV